MLTLARELRHSFEAGFRAIEQAMEAYDNAVGHRRQAAIEFLHAFISAKARFDDEEARALAAYREWFENKPG